MNSRVKLLRKKLELNQDEFGKKIGITNFAISKIEKGINKLTDQNITVICHEFNVNEEWLRTGTGEMFVKKSRNEEIEAFVEKAQFENSFKIRFISMLSKLNENDWEVLEKIALILYNENTEKYSTQEKSLNEKII